MARVNDYVFMGCFMVGVIMFLHLDPTLLGLTSTDVDDFLSLLPGILITLAALIGVKNTHGLERMASMIGVGFGLVIFIDKANTINMITTELLSGLTVSQLKLFTAAFAILFGAIGYLNK